MLHVNYKQFNTKKRAKYRKQFMEEEMPKNI